MINMSCSWITRVYARTQYDQTNTTYIWKWVGETLLESLEGSEMAMNGVMLFILAF